ncbi:MAG: DUF4200 domain-containing protein [Deltaproteobacteria bacterium]|nr:DUF4200 domain-containing protein [Deltaproteobacteria bacterium]
MVESDSNPPPKKSPLRKKVVDLKAVAALLEESDGRDAVSRETAMKEAAPQAGSASQPGSGPQAGEGTAPLAAPQAGSAPSSKPVLQPNEELIQATSRIKTQRDLIKRRFQKMEQNRDKVTKGVFDKVYRDYAMQLDAINKLLGEKKALLHRELKNLYTRREKQDLDMTRHKEILEEARFRHYLDEYSEAQFKEVEEYETREIRQLQGELAQIQSFIKLHEELFDPEDLGFAPTGGGSRGMESRTEMRRVAAPPAPATPLAPATPRLGTGPRPDMDDWAEKTPLPEKAAVPAPSRASATSRAPAGEEMARILPSADAGEDSVFALPPEGFGPEGLAPDEPGYFSAEAPAKAGEPESIFDVFEKMPLGAEVSSTEPKGGMETAQPVSGRHSKGIWTYRTLR